MNCECQISHYWNISLQIIMGRGQNDPCDKYLELETLLYTHVLQLTHKNRWFTKILIYRYVCISGNICNIPTCIFLFCYLIILEAMIPQQHTQCPYLDFFNTILQNRELVVLEEITDSKTGTGNIQGDFAIRKCTRKKSAVVEYIKQTQEPTERAP